MVRIDPQRLRSFADSNVVAAKLRVTAYEEAFDGHKLAKSKLQKGEKKKQQMLQQDERQARTRAHDAARVVKSQMDLLEEDWANTLLNLTIDMAHNQLTLHAKGVEHYSQVLSQLQAVAKEKKLECKQ